MEQCWCKYLSLVLQETWWEVRTRSRWLTSRSLWERPALRVLLSPWTGEVKVCKSPTKTQFRGLNVFLCSWQDLHGLHQAGRECDRSVCSPLVFSLPSLVPVGNNPYALMVCSGLCAVALRRVHGRAGLHTPAPHVQPAEDRGDLLLQHEPHPAAVVSHLAGDRRSFQQGGSRFEDAFNLWEHLFLFVFLEKALMF